MNKIYSFLMSAVMVLAATTLSSCSDEEEGKAVVDYSAPSRVTEVTTQSVAGGVVLSWKRPSEGSCKYAKVSY